MYNIFLNKFSKSTDYIIYISIIFICVCLCEDIETMDFYLQRLKQNLFFAQEYVLVEIIGLDKLLIYVLSSIYLI